MKTFKEGDKVFHLQYGWGEITTHEENAIIRVKFFADTIAFMDGNLLSFTEYTLQGFSQERPIVLPKVGELCLVRDYNDEYWRGVEFKRYDKTLDFCQFIDSNNDGWKQMKRIKILD
jgi:hypothetical protein